MASVLDVTLPGEIAAWHYAPEGATACVVMAHGFSAVRDQRLPAYAERFAQAGLAALLFDYRHFGSSCGRPPPLLGIPHHLADWRAGARERLHIPSQRADWRTARGWARNRYERIGVFGSSFGGGHAVELARTEP